MFSAATKIPDAEKAVQKVVSSNKGGYDNVAVQYIQTLPSKNPIPNTPSNKDLFDVFSNAVVYQMRVFSTASGDIETILKETKTFRATGNATVVVRLPTPPRSTSAIVCSPSQSASLRASPDAPQSGFWIVTKGKAKVRDTAQVQTEATSMDVGQVKIQWIATNFDDVSYEDEFVIEVFGTDGAMTVSGHLATLTARVPDGTNGTWRVAKGAGSIDNDVHPVTGAEGSKVVNFEWTFLSQSSKCPGVSSSVNVTFTTLECLSGQSTVCNNHGTCNQEGSCVCFASVSNGYWAGAYCDRCKDGYSAVNCSRPTCRSGATDNCLHGTCTSPSTCMCSKGNATAGFWDGPFCNQCLHSATLGFWSGASCNSCAKDIYGPSCVVTCIGNFTCSGHGSCNTSGMCDCQKEWDGGPSCAQCAKGYFGAGCKGQCTSTTCNGRGTCQHNGSCVCFSHSGVGYYAGPTCMECQATFSGPKCLGESSLGCTPGGNTCMHGTCDEASNCQCFRNATLGGWAGVTCNRCQSDPVEGYWTGPNCTRCVDGYYGPSCSTPCPFDKCSGRGGCSNASSCACEHSIVKGFWKAPSCATCLDGFSGEKCNRACSASLCGSGGACNENGTCQCYANASKGYWSGVSCQECVAGFSMTGGCRTCANDFYGVNCTNFCSSATCNEKGSCSAEGKCICMIGWVQPACKECAPGYGGKTCAKAACLSPVRVINATFASNLGSVEVIFSGVLNEVQSVVCANLLGEGTFARLGPGTACKWRSSSLHIMLGSGSTMVANDTVHVLAGMVLDPNKCIVGAFKVPIELPSTVMAPVARIQAPSSASACDDVVLTTSHSTLRGSSNTITYSVVGDESDTLSLFLATQAGKFLVRVPTAYIPVGNITVAVVITDLVSGLRSVATARFEKPSTPRPSLNINTAVRSHISSAPLQLSAEVEVTSCAVFLVAYAWKVSPPLLLPQITKNGYFYASARAFAPNTLYLIEVSVTDNQTSYKTSSTFRVFVAPLPIVAVLSHPAFWEHTLGRPITLKGSCVGANTSQYVWTCLVCSPELLQALSNIGATSIVVPTSVTWRPQVSRVVLTCDKASTFTDVEFFAPATNATLQREASPTFDGPRTASPNVRLVVTGASPANYTWQWVCESHASLDLTKSNVCPTGPRGRILVLLPGTLLYGSTYAFRADVTTPKGTAFALRYEFETSDAPSAGIIEVEMLSATEVFLTASKWVGASTLEYSFAIATEDGEVTSLSDWTTSATLTARIPTTASLAENVIALVLKVRDIYSSVTTVSETLLVMKPQVPTVFKPAVSLFDMAFQLMSTGECPADVPTEIQRVANLTSKTESQIAIQQKLLLFYSSCPTNDTNAKSSMLDQVGSGLKGEDGTAKYLDPAEASRMVNVLSGILASSPEGSAPSAKLAEKSISLAMSVAESLISGAVDGEVHTVTTEAVTLNCSVSSGVLPVTADGAAFAFASTASLRDSAVTTMGARWKVSPVGKVPNVTSDLVSFSVQFADGNTTLPSPVLITVPLRPNTTSTPSCVFYNFIKKDFDHDGCTVRNITATSVICACTHLTDFAILDLKIPLPPKPMVNKIAWGNFADTKVGAASVLAGISAAFGVLIFLCRGWQEKQRRTFAALEVERHLYVSRMFCKEVSCRTSSFPWSSVTSVARGQLCRAAVVTEREENPFTRTRLQDSFRLRHEWLAIFFVGPQSNDNLSMRASALAVYIMMSLFFTGLFFKTGDASTADLASSIFYTVVITEAGIVVVGYVLHFFFVKIKEGTVLGVKPRGFGSNM